MIVEKRYFTFGSEQEPLVLESGKTLGPVTLAYETYGQPNPDKSNAILILHALTGDSHAAGYYDKTDRKPGWWNDLIGPGKAFDTERFWIVCSNVLGGCKGSTGPGSENPITGKPYGIDFPMITVGDMVEAQRYLMDFLGISQWYAIAGGSMGGFQVLEWALRFPDRVNKVLCMASAAKVSAQAIAFNAVGRHAIISDPLWENGSYYDAAHEGPTRGLATARMLAHITYLSEVSLEAKFGRRLQASETFRYDIAHEFAVESYLQYQGQQFIERFDANSYLYITKAMDYFDLAQQYGPLYQAMSRIQAKMLLIAYSSDWLFPPVASQMIAKALMHNGKDVSYLEVDSDYGHDAFLLEVEQMTRVVRSFLQTSDVPNLTTSTMAAS